MRLSERLCWNCAVDDDSSVERLRERQEAGDTDSRSQDASEAASCSLDAMVGLLLLGAGGITSMRLFDLRRSEASRTIRK
jgi:hypothetical protein